MYFYYAFQGGVQWLSIIGLISRLLCKTGSNRHVTAQLPLVATLGAGWLWSRVVGAAQVALDDKLHSNGPSSVRVPLHCTAHACMQNHIVPSGRCGRWGFKRS